MLSTPGVLFLLHNLPRILAPPASVGLVHILCRNLGITFPIWLILPLYLFCWPAYLVVLVQWRDYVNRREAHARGARLAPVVKSRGFGNWETVKTIMEKRAHGYLADPFFRWSENHGSIFNLRVFFEDRIFTSDPEHIKNMLAVEFPNHEKGPHFRELAQPLLGTGVFNSDGEMWKFHRGMTRPFFSKERVSHLHIFERHADHALQKAKERFAEGYAVNWQDLVSRFTLDSATEFLCGQDLQTLSANLPYPSTANIGRGVQEPVHPADRFARAFLAAQEATAERSFVGNMWPMFEFFKDSVKPHIQIVDDFIEPIIKKALEDKKQREVGHEKDIEASEDEPLLSHLVNLTSDPVVIRDETLNILLAGRDSTACTLTFGVYMLAEHPDVLQRLRQEIGDRVGFSDPPTLENIREMKYLRAFINETLRMYPPVPINERSSTEPTVWKSSIPGEKGIYMEAGTQLLYSVFLMHRRKDLWGPDALEFDPDRFLDERMQKYLIPNPFIFLPFNAGPRICLGQQFAYNEVSFMLVRLLQQFSSIELVQEVEPRTRLPPGYSECPGQNGKEKVWVRSHLTMYAYNGVWVRMVEAPPADLS